MELSDKELQELFSCDPNGTSLPNDREFDEWLNSLQWEDK